MLVDERIPFRGMRHKENVTGSALVRGAAVQIELLDGSKAEQDFSFRSF